VPVEAFVPRQEAFRRREQVVVGAGADLDDDDARGRMRDEDREEAVRLVGDEGRAGARQVRDPRTGPRPDRERLRPYGKMLRSASRRRPRPPPPGADS
jgi:hypothetical protein